MVKNIPLYRLLKLELPNLANKVISAVEKQDPEILKFNESFEVLENLKPRFINLEARYKGHPLTKDLNVLRKERLHFASLIIDQMRLHAKADKVEMRPFIKEAYPVVDRFLTNLRENNDDQISELVIQFFDQIDNNEELETALSSLGVTSDLNELRNVNSTLEEILAVRNASISGRPKKGNPPSRKSIINALRNMFNHINVVKLQNLELNYMVLIDELNGILSSYEAKINQRASVNKRKAEGIIDDKEVGNDDIEVDDESEEPITTTSTTTMRVFPMNEEEGQTIENLDNVDKERTVAVSSITNSVPIVPTKD